MGCYFIYKLVLFLHVSDRLAGMSKSLQYMKLLPKNHLIYLFIPCWEVGY